jgi:hypothetical protein
MVQWWSSYQKYSMISSCVEYGHFTYQRKDYNWIKNSVPWIANFVPNFISLLCCLNPETRVCNMNNGILRRSCRSITHRILTVINQLHSIQWCFTALGFIMHTIWTFGIKINLTEVVCEGVNWIHLAQDVLQPVPGNFKIRNKHSCSMKGG